jgi:phosphate-selective porin
MYKPTLKLAVLLAFLFAGTAVHAQESKALIDALIKKGILTEEEAKAVQAEAKKSALSFVEVKTKPVTKLQISGRLQAQFDGLNTDRTGADNAATTHFFVRRAYLTVNAALGKDWAGNMTWDFAGSFFDAFNIQYKGWADKTLTLGIKKVNFGIEENTSSGSLKAIERSGVTRFFVESNNARRLGAGSYRTGIFLDGTEGNFFWGAAVTNPERTSTPSSIGTGANNNVAFWANVGVKGKMDGGDYTLGVNAGLLPDQGGKTLGTGSDLTVVSLNAAVNSGNFSVLAEYLISDNDNGAAVGRDSKSSGFWIQPSYKFNKNLEGVVRYSYLDSDGRGVDLSDGVRNAPGGGTHDKLHDFYLGGTYYIFGNDLKFQAGFVYGRTKDTISGGTAESTSYGARSQVQLNF